jgi:hypothetical protein
MKTLFTFLLLFSTSSFAQTYFSCDFQSRMEGRVQLNGSIGQSNGDITVKGDGALDSSYSSERVFLNRQIRPEEPSFSYAKYSGGTLFRFYYLSIPKNLEASRFENFKAYLTILREGVGGKKQFELDCKKSTGSSLIRDFVRRYSNIITYDRLSEADRQKVQPVQKFNVLPERVRQTLLELDLAIAVEWDVIQGPLEDAYHMISFSDDVNSNDALAILGENGEVVGFAFNVTSCNPEECYGWDALYLDAEGTIFFKSF